MEIASPPFIAAGSRTVQTSQSAARSESKSSSSSSSNDATGEVRSGLPEGLGAGAREARGDQLYVFVHMPHHAPAQQERADAGRAAPGVAHQAGNQAAGEGALVFPPPPAQPPLFRSAGRILARNGFKDFAARLAGGAVRSAVVAALTDAGRVDRDTRDLGIFAGVLTGLAGARVLFPWSRLSGLAAGASTLALAAELAGIRPRLRLSFTGQLAGAYATEMSRELMGFSSDVYLRVPAAIDPQQRARLQRESLSALTGPGKFRTLAHVVVCSMLLWLPSELKNAALAPGYVEGGFADRWMTDFRCEAGQAVVESVLSVVDARYSGLELNVRHGRSLPAQMDAVHVFQASAVRFALDTFTLLLGAALVTLDPDEQPALFGLCMVGLVTIQGYKRMRAHAAEEGVSGPAQSAWATFNANDIQVGPGSSLRRWPRAQPAE